MTWAEREKLNLFHNWYPNVKDCGIKQPQTEYFVLPPYGENAEVDRLYQAFYMDNGREDLEYVRNWLDKYVVPKLNKKDLNGHVFLKNAVYSGKFTANNSCNLYGLLDLAEHLVRINYDAMCCGANGETGIVVRKYIERNARETPCIYDGLPLRPEFRVFYDFSKEKVIFTANYWDYDYVAPHLFDATDKIIFEHEKDRIEKAFNENRQHVEKLVSDAMKNVKGMQDQWSIDILLDEKGVFWLIDMAVAQRSSYWEFRPDKEEYPDERNYF